MDDSFRVRLDKAFGTLASASSSSSISPPSSGSSLWCLTDDEIERNKWNRDQEGTEEKETEPIQLKRGSFISHREKSQKELEFELEKDLDDLDDDDLDDEQPGNSTSQVGKPKPDDYNDEEWEIKNSIGTDCTLDYEEEEDQFDKVAVGKENVEERLYMKDAVDYGVDIDSNELPSSLKEVPRDPRANHVAAKLRLKEDAEAAKKMDSLRVSEQDSSAIVDNQAKAPENGTIKSILKRKEDDSDSKSKKRVRFDPECKDGLEEDTQMETDSTDKSLVYPLPPDYPSGIPDYMRNPSKYTHYTFDSLNDVDEQSNRQAYMDFLKMLKKSDEPRQEEASGELPKSLTFVPKKKASDSEKKQNEEPLNRKGLLVRIAAAGAEESELCAMDEDVNETPADKRKSSERGARARSYRTKPRLEADESI